MKVVGNCTYSQRENLRGSKADGNLANDLADFEYG